MFKGREVFETHYMEYCRQIGRADLVSAADILGGEYREGLLYLRFLDREFSISGAGILDASGIQPDYILCVILARYLLACPERIHHDPEWVTFKDFKRNAQFTNVNYFTSDTEQKILNVFSGRGEMLLKACEDLGGRHHDLGIPYDVSMAVEVLPRIPLLLLYNDEDDEFPAQCRVLFPKHGEFYLDPESLAMLAAGFAARLAKANKGALGN